MRKQKWFISGASGGLGLALTETRRLSHGPIEALRGRKAHATVPLQR
jgi:hypothetical protein